jgi:hypothetical protein
MKLPTIRGRKRVLAPAALAVLAAVGLVGSTALAAAAPGPLFQPAGTYDVGHWPVDSTAADLDGDGDNDLATANQSPDGVSVLLNNGDGTFAPARTYHAVDSEDGSGPSNVLAADFNEDGALDLATANNVFTSQVSILLNNGDGTFAPPDVLDLGASVAAGLTAGDFNRDGNVDVVVANSFSEYLSTLLGNGDGTFQEPTVQRNGYTYPDRYGLEGRPAEVMSADFNGDGMLDVAVLGEGRGGDSLTPLLGNGDGTFRQVKDPGTAAEGYFVDVCFAPDINKHSRDFNGDGVPDLAVVNSCSPGKTIIFLGNGDGLFTRGESYPSQSEPQSLDVADLDGDGTSDLAVTRNPHRGRTGEVVVLTGAGDGTFQPTTQPPSYPVGQTPFGPTAADLNGDGKPDLATANGFSDSVTVLFNIAGP